MAGIMYLGNQIVSPVILQGKSGGGFIGVPKFSVVDGVPVALNYELTGNEFDGITEIDSNILGSMYANTQLSGIVGFGDLEYVSGDNGLDNTFSYTKITEANFPKLKQITGENAFTSAFFNAYDLESVDLSALEKASSYALDSFCYNTKVETLNFTNLYDLDGEGPMYRALAGMMNLSDVYFNSLTTQSFSDPNLGEYVFYDNDGTGTFTTRKIVEPEYE